MELEADGTVQTEDIMRTSRTSRARGWSRTTPTPVAGRVLAGSGKRAACITPPGRHSPTTNDRAEPDGPRVLHGPRSGCRTRVLNLPSVKLVEELETSARYGTDIYWQTIREIVEDDFTYPAWR